MAPPTSITNDSNNTFQTSHFSGANYLTTSRSANVCAFTPVVSRSAWHGVKSGSLYGSAEVASTRRTQVRETLQTNPYYPLSNSFYLSAVSSRGSRRNNGAVNSTRGSGRNNGAVNSTRGGCRRNNGAVNRDSGRNNGVLSSNPVIGRSNESRCRRAVQDRQIVDTLTIGLGQHGGHGCLIHGTGIGERLSCVVS